jgi:hypothetical protein
MICKHMSTLQQQWHVISVALWPTLTALAAVEIVEQPIDTTVVVAECDFALNAVRTYACTQFAIVCTAGVGIKLVSSAVLDLQDQLLKPQ